MHTDESQLLEAIERWVERSVRPVVREFDHADRYPTQIVEEMRELGLFGAIIPAEFGGLGLPAATYARIVMRIASAWMAITGIFNSHLMLALAIQKFGTPAQKARWLPRLATGELRGGLALTEPDAGTDLQAIRMTARREGAEYVIDGTKTWISNGIEGSCFALLVKTDARAEPRHRGMSLFIAPKGKGMKVGGKLGKLGYRSIDSAELAFDGYRVPADHLIGEAEGQGFYQATGGLLLGRINVAARGVGVAEAALQQATQYARTRKSFGKPICEHQAIQLKLAEMATRARAVRLLTLDAAAAFDRGERCDLEAGMASTSPPRRRWRTAPRRCASTAPTATRPSTTSSGSTAMRRCCASARAPTRCSASSSRGSSWREACSRAQPALITPQAMRAPALPVGCVL